MTGELSDDTRDSFKEGKEHLSQLEYDVTQHGATEEAYSGEYDHFSQKGLYVDVVSGEPLFTSDEKFDAGCGWPSFSRPIASGAITHREDYSNPKHFKIEVRSAQAHSHLGHVFTDGPKESGGLRYCINSAALRFIPVAELEREGYAELRTLFDETHIQESATR